MPAFGTYRVDLAEERIWNGDNPLSIRRKPFAILRFLLANPRRLVTHQELLDTVWGGATVSESAMRTHLHELRQALGEGVIETVVGRGYRFTAALIDDSRPAEVPVVRDRGVVGRDAELAMLRAAFERADGGHRQICFVTGEPGIGKTTLVDAFLDGIDTGDVIAMRGQCVEQFGTPEAYLAVIEMLGRLKNARHGDHAIGSLVRYAPTFLSQLPHLLDDGQLADVKRRAVAGTESRMVRELIEAIEAIASQHPMVIVLEDLQWSDVATIDLLAMLGQRRERARLLLIATSRRAEAQTVTHPLNRVMRSLVARSGASAISVERLVERDVRSLLDRRFPGHAFPPDLAVAIDQTTAGTPLYVNTLLDDLVDRGMIAERDGSWRLITSLDEIARHRPDGIKQLIDIQLDRLSLPEQRALEAGSTIGLEFSSAVVAAALETSEEEIDEVLDSLARRALFVRRAEAEEWPDGSLHTRYATAHGLVHEVCVDRGVPARRQRWHRLAAEKLEAAYGDRSPEIAHLLGMHYEKGQHPARAIEHYLVAGARMARRFASSDTMSLFDRALSLLGRLPPSVERDRTELRALQGVTSMHLRGHAPPLAEPLARFERMIALARGLGDPAQLAAALVNTSIRCSTLGNYRRAATLCDEVDVLVAEHSLDGRVVELAETARLVSMIWQGDIVRAHALLAPLVAAAEYGTDIEFDAVLPDRNAVNLAYLTMLEWLLGRPDNALRLAERGAQIAITRGDPWSIGLSNNNLARLRILVGRPAAEARTPALQVLATPLAMVWHGPASLIVAWAEAMDDKLDDSAIDGVLAAFHERLARQPMGPSHLVLPMLELLARLRKVEIARPLLAEVLDICRARNERVFESELLRLRGELAELSDRAAAREDYREAVACARAVGAPMLELRALNRLLAIADDTERDAIREQLAACLARFSEDGCRDVVVARQLLA